MPIPNPMRYIDRSGRNVVWVLINEGAVWHSFQQSYDSQDCRIIMCPTEGQGQPQDSVTRPCHSENSRYFRLKDDLHNWLDERVSNYQLEFRYHENKIGWFVGFHPDEKPMAVLFKLSFAP